MKYNRPYHYTPAAIYQYNALSAPPVRNPSVVLNHFALQTVVGDSLCVATQIFCSKSQTLTRPSIALVISDIQRKKRTCLEEVVPSDSNQLRVLSSSAQRDSQLVLRGVHRILRLSLNLLLLRDSLILEKMTMTAQCLNGLEYQICRG
jgi:hypothetical protein